VAHMAGIAPGVPLGWAQPHQHFCRLGVELLRGDPTAHHHRVAANRTPGRHEVQSVRENRLSTFGFSH